MTGAGSHGGHVAAADPQLNICGFGTKVAVITAETSSGPLTHKMNGPSRLSLPAPIARAIRAVVSLLGFAFAPLALAQGVVSAGLTGAVRDEGGKPVAGATLTAVHLPTRTTYSAVSTDTGRYHFRGMIVGGPYSLIANAAGKKPV